jgi:hypothetical protein
MQRSLEERGARLAAAEERCYALEGEVEGLGQRLAAAGEAQGGRGLRGFSDAPSCCGAHLRTRLLPPGPPHPSITEARLQHQAEAAAASSSEFLQQRVAELEEQLRCVNRGAAASLWGGGGGRFFLLVPCRGENMSV